MNERTLDHDANAKRYPQTKLGESLLGSEMNIFVVILDKRFEIKDFSDLKNILYLPTKQLSRSVY